MNILDGIKRVACPFFTFTLILSACVSFAAEQDNLTRCVEVENEGVFMCRPNNDSSAKWVKTPNLPDLKNCEKTGTNSYLCRIVQDAAGVSTVPANGGRTPSSRVYVRPSPAFTGYTPDKLSSWFYVDISAEYYHIPKDSSYAEPLHGTGAGGRLGVGYRRRLGPGYASLGLQGGFHPVTDSRGDEDIYVTAIPIVLKAEYGFDITENFLLRAGLSGGIIYGRTKNEGSGWDPLMGTRVYGQFKITEAAGAYLGLGGDCAFEKDGNILLPAAEIGLRLTL